MSIGTCLNTGIALAGWLYIMFKTGEWIISHAFRQWDKRRKETRQQKAINELYGAFELGAMNPGDTVKITTKGDLTIMMFRKEAQ
ncbi:DUF4752 family protein [Salmonella enterica]|nr:DUF4752 family protein [Salmonella enterica]